LTLREARVCFPSAPLDQGTPERAPFEVCSTIDVLAHMQEAIQPTTLSEAAEQLAAAAYRAETWAGEPFLYDGEDVEKALAPGTARRRALDDAIAELDSGKAGPTPQWKVHYGLMLGLERVLADPEPWSRAGLERSAALSWDRTAQATVDVYREVLA